MEKILGKCDKFWGKFLWIRAHHCENTIDQMIKEWTTMKWKLSVV